MMLSGMVKCMGTVMKIWVALGNNFPVCPPFIYLSPPAGDPSESVGHIGSVHVGPNGVHFVVYHALRRRN